MTAEQDDFENARALAATGRILSGLAKLVKNHLNDALKLALLCGWKMIAFGSHRWHLQSGIIAWQGLRRRAAAALPSKGDGARLGFVKRLRRRADRLSSCNGCRELMADERSEERSVGKGCVGTCRSRGS